MKKTVFPIFLATIWISISEFVRNQWVLATYWTEHYKEMGLEFPSAPVNGAVWGIWSLCSASVIFIISKRFTLFETTFIAWISGFVMMWLVVGNLSVLPFGILPVAIPLSLLEAFVASYIVRRMSR